MEKRSNLKIKMVTISIMAAVLVGTVQLGLPSSLEAITLQELGERVSRLSTEEEQLVESIIASETQVQINRGTPAIIKPGS
ncbi:MAG: hypothetical protein U5N58_12495 [Actinomycetota bacterium]|nr:hypothetical protein [Actinomycetota bacterium]